MPDKREKEEPLWNCQDIGKYIGRSAKTIARWVKQGQLPKPTVVLSRIRLWSPDVIRRWKKGLDEGASKDK